MKVLLRRNIRNLGNIGDVVEVKPGYARNYLLPQRLATEPTPGNVKAVEAERHRYLEELAKERAQVEARAELVRGKELTLHARANEEGHLFGSVGAAQIVAELAKENIFIDAENVLLDEPIRELDKYDVQLRFAEDITATIHVWILPIKDDDAEEGSDDSDEPAGQDDQSNDEE